MTKSLKSPRVIAYARVSTSDQAVDGVSLDAQQARILAWCAAHGATLDPADVHVDAGLSGKRADNRPALQAALDAVCQARGVLVVYALARLARSTKDTIAIAERLDRAGAAWSASRSGSTRPAPRARWSSACSPSWPSSNAT